MIRWKYLLPRLGGVLVLVFLVYTLSSPIAHFAAVRLAQSVTGAKVEIDSLDASLWEGSVTMEDFQVANPRKPMRNIVQADTAEFNLDTNQLVRRRWVVEKAILRGVQFDTPRTESGELESTPVEKSEDSRIVRLATEKIGSFGKQWAEQMKASLPSLIEENLETVRVANEIRDRWPRVFEQQREVAHQLQNRAKNLKVSIQQTADNPLRDLERLRADIVESRQLLLDFQSAQQTIHGLSTQYRTDQQALVAARQRDQETIMSVAKGIDIRGENLTRLLLSEQQLELTGQVSSWLKWFRDVVPKTDPDFRPERARGFDVQFRQHPAFLFQEIELEGGGTVGGREIQFAGLVRNLSSSPQWVDEPTTFELGSSGDTQIALSGTIDRRGPQKIDVINFSCPQIAAPARQLGSADALLVDLESGTMRLDLNVRIVDEQLEGQLRINRSNVKLNVVQARAITGSDSGSDASIRSLNSLNEQLASLNQFEIAVNLSGTLEHPKAELQSDLGEKFAGIIGNAFKETLRQAAVDKAARLQGVLETELASLVNLYSQNTGELMALLSSEVASVADLQKLTDPKRLFR